MLEQRKGRGSNWVKMEDVAQRAGVSMITVSRAYTVPDKVAQKTRGKILKAAAELGYVPNLVAGNLASNRSRVIGLVVPTLANSNFAKTLEGLADCIHARGYELLFANSGFSAEKEAEVVATFLGRRPDGIILTGNDHAPELGTLLRAAAVPVVETWTVREPVIDMAVGFSDFDAMLAITRHVIASGRKRIGYIDFHTEGVQRYVQRRNGFREAVQRAGLPDHLIRNLVAGREYMSGRSGLTELLTQEPLLDGLVCCTDIPAAGAIFECQSRGWAIPGRIAIAGFGDFEIAKEIPPGLTTIRSHATEMGRLAATMLLDRLAGAEVVPKIRDVGFELVVRGSA